MTNAKFWGKCSLKISSRLKSIGSGPIAVEDNSSELASASLRSAVPQFAAHEAH